MDLVMKIGHLELYDSVAEEFGCCVTRNLNDEYFEQLAEYEVESIVDEKWCRSKKGRGLGLLLLWNMV